MTEESLTETTGMISFSQVDKLLVRDWFGGIVGPVKSATTKILSQYIMNIKQVEKAVFHNFIIPQTTTEQ